MTITAAQYVGFQMTYSGKEQTCAALPLKAAHGCGSFTYFLFHI